MLNHLIEKIPDNVLLSSKAIRDVKSLHKKNSAETARVIEDLIRLAKKQIPSTQFKKLSGLQGLWQLDTGRYRIAFLWRGKTLYISTIFPKTSQNKIFRHMH